MTIHGEACGVWSASGQCPFYEGSRGWRSAPSSVALVGLVKCYCSIVFVLRYRESTL